MDGLDGLDESYWWLDSFYLVLSFRNINNINNIDPFDQDDWEAYGKLTAEVGKDVQIVGDDLLVTNPKRIET